MTREQLEHAIRAVADITGELRLIVIGSQAVLGQFPNAPPELLVSREADIFAPERPDLSDLVSATIGEGSQFDITYRYFVDGVSPTTAMLPSGWETRLVEIRNENTRGASGWCLEVHDLAIAKYVANREKDRRFNRALWKHGLIQASIFEERLSATDIGEAGRRLIRAAARRHRRREMRRK